MLSFLLAASIIAMPQEPVAFGSPLEEQLRAELPTNLAADARKLGNPARGAVVFHQPQTACLTCHLGTKDQPSIGPDLTKLGPATTDLYLVESLLYPSKSIKPAYATIKIARKDGRTLTGLLLKETADQMTLRDLSVAKAEIVTIDKSEIEERKNDGPSSMPTGLVNGLKSRDEFLDLISYLRAIADGGPERAIALKPQASLLAPAPLPTYESNLDHSGIIRGFGAGSLARGESIYLRVCSNCHGTKSSEGSMPTSLRFVSGKFKNGSDPYSMYKTLTHGYGQMPAQSWMVPQQKYDVIHYLREIYLKQDNPTQYTSIDRKYLASLPKGKSRGPQPTLIEPWSEMDYGPTLMATIEVAGKQRNFAYKGIAVRLDQGSGGISKGKAFALFDHDTMRLAGFWTGPGFIDWNGINLNGRHGVHPKTVGKIQVETPEGPGWANPATGSFEDPRLLGRDGRAYGPMPKEWLKYVGMYAQESGPIIAYRVGDVEVLDHLALVADLPEKSDPVLERTIELAATSKPLSVRVSDKSAAVAIVGEPLTIEVVNESKVIRIPPSSVPRSIRLLLSSMDATQLAKVASSRPAGVSLRSLTMKSPIRWPQELQSKSVTEPGTGAFQVDILNQPKSTPWRSQMRLTGLDFVHDRGELVVCDWDGDVWRVAGLDRPDGVLTWRRIASGLFQPLGLKIVDGKIYVSCRDQIVILRDLNQDGETDFYECFNDDHQVTDHFHEFAMDLQTDDEGHFYYAKGARHALKAVVPQHGTLLRVNKDGSRTDILANGFRAPNGVAVRKDGTFYVTDQEGHWIPKNRVNWVRPGRFYGNLWGFTDVTDPADSQMEPPVSWITNAFDRSPAQVLEVSSPKWKPIQGRYLTLSYGYGKVFLLLEESKGEIKQGGLVELPIKQFPTGLIRGRFRPEDGALYTCGMYAWAGNQQQPGGLYRIKRTSEPLGVATGLKSGPGYLDIEFADPVDRGSLGRDSFAIKTWGLKRSVNYGSEHLNEKALEVAGLKLLEDQRTVRLTLPDLLPTMGMEIKYQVKSVGGGLVVGVIHNTIHQLDSTANGAKPQ